ncbi:MAG: helix-turn-helix transcriptional regulator [Clostridia bacterium]|nr:helix-turn-helix transcriptional regulator [Clostridia bacterium]MBQ7076505.1 helix-turn-helix transcriptional regulator [Clostridia bacterium]MBQ9997757.1 helix-turn-helix transcriptional regulator [Clostridia bacterium]
MSELRYEEHSWLNEKLPFFVNFGIEITPTKYSHQANWHENLELQYCSAGVGVVSLDGEMREVSQGDIVAVNTNVIHHITSKERVCYTCLIIDQNFCNDADIDTHNLRFIPYFRNETMASLFRELNETYVNTNDVCRIAKLRDIVLRILIELRTNYVVADSTDNSVKKDVFNRVKHTIKYIRENYSQKMSLDEIAKNVFSNKYVLSREFKKATNHTIIEYINSYRCKKAKGFIEEGYTIGETARMCGFDNMSFFTKTFKRFMGKLPSDYK